MLIEWALGKRAFKCVKKYILTLKMLTISPTERIANSWTIESIVSEICVDVYTFTYK